MLFDRVNAIILKKGTKEGASANARVERLKNIHQPAAVRRILMILKRRIYGRGVTRISVRPSVYISCRHVRAILPPVNRTSIILHNGVSERPRLMFPEQVFAKTAHTDRPRPARRRKYFISRMQPGDRRGATRENKVFSLARGGYMFSFASDVFR